MEKKDLIFIKNYRRKNFYDKGKNYQKFSSFPKIFFFYKFSKNFDEKTLKQKLYFLNRLSMITPIKFGYLSGENNFPTIWSLEERYNWLYKKKKFNGWGDLEISSNCLRVRYKGFGRSDEDAAAIRTNSFIPNHLFLFYFEIKILSIGKKGFIGVGLCGKNEGLNRLPGWEKNSLGYHGDDGFIFQNSGTGTPYGPRYVKNDVIGLCLNFYEKSVFFTKNGLGLGLAFVRLDQNFLNEMYPLIGLRTKEETIIANFGIKPFEFDIHFYKRNFQTYIEKKISSYKTKLLYFLNYFQFWPKNKNNKNLQFISNFFSLLENILKKQSYNNEKLMFHDLIVKNYQNSFFLLKEKSLLLKKSWEKLSYSCISWTCPSFRSKFYDKMTDNLSDFSKDLKTKKLIHFMENKFLIKEISQKLKKKMKKYLDIKNHKFLPPHFLSNTLLNKDYMKLKVPFSGFSDAMFSTCYFEIFKSKSKKKNNTRFLLFRNFIILKIFNMIKKKKIFKKIFNIHQISKSSELENCDYFFLMWLIGWVI